MSPTDAELLAWLDESLSPERLAAIEAAVRESDDLRERCARLLAERDAGGFSLGEIWRRYRLTCPDRAVLGAYLLQALPDDRMAYLRFHLERVGCHVCRANLDDLQGAGSDHAEQAAASRRRRLFQSSVGSLSRRDG
jgi:hypothetical protein